jgi:hypothetical protein
MGTQTTREAVLRRPFMPFTMRMNDGREFLIPHPEYVAASPITVMVVDSKTNAGVILEPKLIASLQEVSGVGKVASKSNGQAENP